MKLIGIYDVIPKTKWVEIAKVLKNKGRVYIYPTKFSYKYKPLEIKNTVLAFTEDSIIDMEKDKVRVESFVSKKAKSWGASLLDEPEIIYHITFDMKANAIGSRAVARVGEALKEEHDKYLTRTLNRKKLLTEEGVLGLFRTLTRKVSSKIARDTFEIDLSNIILGEMRVTNTTLIETHPTRKWYAHSVAIGADEYGDFFTVGICKGDDTENGLSGQHTFASHDFDPNTFPIAELKKGNYRGEDFNKILDLVFRTLILASTEGYNEYVEENGTPYYGANTEYAWLTLKDGTKVTWENYDFNQLAQLLVQ